jgi:hypothetical protein
MGICTCIVFIILWLFVSHRPLPHPREIALADAEMVLQEDPYFVKEGLFLSQSYREKTLPSTTLTEKEIFYSKLTQKELFPPSLTKK